MKRILLLVLITGLAACAPTPPEMLVINDAAEALGGRDRIQAAKSIVLEGTGTNGNFGQNFTPDADLPIFDVKDFKRYIDLANGRVRHEQTRVATAPDAVHLPQVQKFGLDGDVGYNLAPDGQATRQTELVARDRRLEFLMHHPFGIVRAALDPAARVTDWRTAGSLEVVNITTAQGDQLTLAVDSATRLPAWVTSMSYNPNLGDVVVETAFADYQKIDGFNLPARLTTKIDKFQTADLRLTNNSIDAAIPDLAASDQVKAQPAPITTATVTVEEVGKGIWFLAGQTHNSVLVEFTDHTELIEVPQNDTRALAVIAKARELTPEKPLRKAVVTHHHYDHSGGIRAAIAEGITLVTHERNKAFFEDLAKRRHTIVQDALAKNPKPATIETVGDEEVVKDARQTMHIYHVLGSNHTESMVMVYFPSERLLVQGDLLNNPNPNPTRVPTLVENIQKRNLRIDKYAPLHGRITTQAEFAKVLRSLNLPAAAAN